jgi:hypothetical protein
MRIGGLCLMLSLVVQGCAAQSGSAGPADAGGTAGPLDLSPYKLKLIYANDFSREQPIAREEDFIARAPDGSWRRAGRPDPNAHWIVEGWGGAEIRDGKLRVAPSAFDPAGRPMPVESGQRSHMVVWNRKVFPADFLLEFEFSPCGSTNGLALVLFCANGKDGGDIFDPALAPRRANYATYHSGEIANYSDSFWSRNTQAESVSNRLRKNPGFRQVAEGPSLTTGPTDATHHVRILKIGPHIEVEINGHVVLGWDDPDTPLGPGRIGFRSMEGVSMVTYERIKAWQVERKPATIQ